MQQQNNNVTSFGGLCKVQIKVLYQGQNRRFSLTAGSCNFSSLVQYLNRLFDFPIDSELQLMYKDDEDDMIIISSDDELMSAIEFFSSTPLKLSIELLKARSGLPQENAQPSLPQENAQLSLPQENAQPSLPQKNAQLSLPQENAQLSLPQENAQQSPQSFVPGCDNSSESSTEGKSGRGRVGRDHVLPLDIRIEKFTQKRNELSEKLKEFETPRPQLEAKIARLDEKINKMKEKALSTIPQQPQVDHIWGLPSNDLDSSTEGKKRGRGGRGGRGGRDGCGKGGRGGKVERDGCGKGGRGGKVGRGNCEEKWENDPIGKQMWILKNEKKQLKNLVNEGPESEIAANVERLVAIQTELKQLRQKKKEQKNQ